MDDTKSDLKPIKIPEMDKYLAYLQPFIEGHEQYREVCLDRKVAKIEVFVVDGRDYTWFTFKDSTLRLIIPDAYRDFMAPSPTPTPEVTPS